MAACGVPEPVRGCRGLRLPDRDRAGLHPCPPCGELNALAGLLGLQVLALVGFAAFYLYELALGRASSPSRAVVSIVLILVSALGLGAMARAWVHGDGWPRTPTMVWSVLLLPVAWGLVQGGHPGLGAVVGAVGLVGLGAARHRPADQPGGRAIWVGVGSPAVMSRPRPGRRGIRRTPDTPKTEPLTRPGRADEESPLTAGHLDGHPTDLGKHLRRRRRR